MNIAIIPARGGSKRIPRKNIKPFCGSPIIAKSIAAAEASGLFKHIIVSTDDLEISSIAREFGAETPFVRPAVLADDTSATLPVIAHAVKNCERLGLDAEYICCIYPCAPFILSVDLRNALTLLQESQAAFAYPVTEYAHPIQRAMYRDVSGRLMFVDPKYELTRTQDLNKTYHDAGQFYWGTKSAWLTKQRMHSDAVGLVIPHWRVVDIDTLDDWRRAELLHEAIASRVGDLE